MVRKGQIKHAVNVDSIEIPPNKKQHKNKYAHFSKKTRNPMDEAMKAQQKIENKAVPDLVFTGTTVPTIIPRATDCIENKPPHKAKSNSNTTTDQIVMDDKNDTIVTKEMRMHPSGVHLNHPSVVVPSDPSTFGFVEIGTILGAHGVHGEVKIDFDTDFGEQRVAPGAVLHIRKPTRRSPRPVRVISGRCQLGNLFIVKLEGVTSRLTATLLKQYKVYVKESDRPKLQPNEYLARDLVGLECFLQNNRQGSRIGIVESAIPPSDLFEGPIANVMHSMLEIKKSRSKELVLVPFVPSIVVDIDFALGRIYLDPPDGLFDETYVEEEKEVIRGFLPEVATVDDDERRLLEAQTVLFYPKGGIILPESDD